jgi:hypothetical protein
VYALHESMKMILAIWYGVVFTKWDMLIWTRFTRKEYGCTRRSGLYSIHESQSRLWENHVGEVWILRILLDLLQEYFRYSEKYFCTDFYNGINKVSPSLIVPMRIDGLIIFMWWSLNWKKTDRGFYTYKRYPAFWNEHYQSYLRITVRMITGFAFRMYTGAWQFWIFPT